MYTLFLVYRFQGYWEGSDQPVTFHLRVPAAYYCSDGCGGGLSDDANGTIYYYNYGECVAQDTCRLKIKPNNLIMYFHMIISTLFS